MHYMIRSATHVFVRMNVACPLKVSLLSIVRHTKFKISLLYNTQLLNSLSPGQAIAKYCQSQPCRGVFAALQTHGD